MRTMFNLTLLSWYTWLNLDFYYMPLTYYSCSFLRLVIHYSQLNLRDLI